VREEKSPYPGGAFPERALFGICLSRSSFLDPSQEGGRVGSGAGPLHHRLRNIPRSPKGPTDVYPRPGSLSRGKLLRMTEIGLINVDTHPVGQIRYLIAHREPRGKND
jgi:hypothetical protein